MDENQQRPLDMLIENLEHVIVPNINGTYTLGKQQAKDLIMEFLDRYATGRAA